MLVKRLFSIVILISYLLLIGCSNKANESISIAKEDVENISVFDEKIEDLAIEDENNTFIETKIELENETTNLLPNPIPNYDPNEVITIEFNGETYATSFFIPRLENFGIYLPTIISTASYEDGDVIFYESERNHFYLHDYNTVFNERTNREISEFTPYIEYKGSYDYAYAYELTFSDNPKIDDSDLNNNISNYFLFEHPDENVLVRFLYKVEDKESVIPLFLDILKTIRYVHIDK